MAYYFPNVDPIYIYKRSGTNEDPFIPLEETKYVKHNALTLTEIPSFEDKVKVFKDNNEEMVEVEYDTLNEDEFRVDYSTGVIHFHSTMNDEKVTVKYHGTGYVDIPTTRIRVPGDDSDPLETLQDTLDRVDEGIETLGQVGSLKYIGMYSPDYQYKKWNFVSYEGKTYVALEDNINQNPATSSVWQLVAGGISIVGMHDSNRIYNVGEVVSNEEKTRLYLSKVDNNNFPLTNSNAWELIIDLESSIDNMVDIIDQQILQLNILKQELIDSDEQRDLKENEREAIFNDLQSQFNLLEQDLNSSESQRQANEAERQQSENLRESNENDRQNNEAQRQQNELERQNNEQDREQRLDSFINNSQTLLDQIEQSFNEISSIKDNIEQLANSTQAHMNQTNEFIEALQELRFIGEYDSDIEYKRYNIVSFNGSSYIAIQDSFNIPPTNEEYWGLISLKGIDGTSITIEGVEADENGDINLSSLDIVRDEQLNALSNDINIKIGDLSNLKTLRKDSIVEAINELKKRIDDLVDLLA